MNTIIERITEAIKDILIGLIKSSLDSTFSYVNEQVGTIAGQVGQTPQGWNAGIFNLIQNISQTVIVPIAGLIITFVLCYELITMVTQKNNFHEFETYNIFLWIFKAYVAIYLVTNLFMRKPIGSSIAAILMVTIMLPFFFMAMYEKDGLPFEKVVANIIRQKFICPAVRPYKTENFYQEISTLVKKEGVPDGKKDKAGGSAGASVPGGKKKPSGKKKQKKQKRKRTGKA